MATKKETESRQNQAEFDVNQEFNKLVEVLQGDVSAIDSESGLELVEQWHSFLSQSKVGGVKELATGLKELQKLLKSDKATGYEISELLIHLGEQTSEFSGDAEKGSKQLVQRLGKQLRKAGTSIAKAEDQEYHQQLDTLMEKAEEKEITSLSPDEAVGAIDLWYNLLHNAEGEKFQNVANSLKSLKQTLKRDNAKPETIAKALTQVGEQTTELATDAPRGFKGVIQKLGKQLTQAGESLATAK